MRIGDQLYRDIRTGAPLWGDPLNNVMAFITNNRFGPEFSAFGKVLFVSIGHLLPICARASLIASVIF